MRLPLAVEKAKPASRRSASTCRQQGGHGEPQENYIGDVVQEDLRAASSGKQAQATGDYSRIAECGTVAICVPAPPTPADADTSYGRPRADSPLPPPREGVMVNAQVTTYPGTTRS